MMRAEKALTAEGVAEVYNVPMGTLANYRWRGEGPKFHRRGKRIIYFVGDVEAWLKSEPVQTTDTIDNRRRR